MLHPLLSLKDLSSKLSQFDKFVTVSDAKDNNKNITLHVLRKGTINLDSKTIVNLYLISDSLCYTGCDWLLTNNSVTSSLPTSNNNSNMNNSKNKIDSIVVNGSNSKFTVSSKPKGLREFLNQFGSLSITSPLFPETIENNDNYGNDKRILQTTTNGTTTNKSNLFFQKLKHQSAVDIVKQIKRYFI